MNAIAHMVSAIHPPAWRGESRSIQLLDREPTKPIAIARKPHPRFVMAWTLIRPGTPTERLMLKTDPRLYWPFPMAGAPT